MPRRSNGIAPWRRSTAAARRPHVNLGATLYYLGRVAEAARSFEHALSLDPDLEAARKALEQVRAVTRQGPE